ncbi:hypothetical protein TWF694_010516 [Orbilia ellipsospora]|uniref:Aminotransferase class I/classII large domain-containing protein n=1 Tax=Orbilia ellipsospora TaxID=2528407 RepID=A0AAV9XAG5_9PEZI
MAEPEVKSKHIDLMRGHPSTELLATSEMLAAANAVLGDQNLPRDSYDEDRHPLHYGPDLGNISFRRDIGSWSARRYGLPQAIPPEKIVLTSGASNGLAKALELFTNPIGGYTRRAFIVTPVYYLACPIFQDFGFSNLMTSIPMESNNTSINFTFLLDHLNLDRSFPPQPFTAIPEGLSPIKSTLSKPLYRYVLYCVPTYSNPTGTTLSLAARNRLVQIAREYDILLLSDDVYDFLGYDGQTPIKRLVDIDREIGVGEGEKGHTISNCSFSKLIGPGIRCGWMESASPMLATVVGKSGASHSGGAPCQFTSTLVHKLLVPNTRSDKLVIDEVIERICEVYKHRVGILKDAVEKYWPEGTQVDGGEGGYFVWVCLPEVYDVRNIARIALDKGVKIGGGDGFEVPVNEVTGKDNFMDWGKRHIRLSISYLDAEVIERGMQILGEAIKMSKA